MPRVLAGERPGMVMNLSYGIQGQARYTHVPSILEMIGIPYVGSGPLAHSIALDKVVTKMVLVQNDLPTPRFAVLQEPEFEAPRLDYPLIVKPKHEAVSFGIRVVRDEAELREAAGLIFEMFGQAVLVEQFVDGREVNVGILGNAPGEALPPVELAFGESGPKVYSYEDKTGASGRTIELLCPAPIGWDLTAKAQQLAVKAFSIVGCSDCARVDMRLDANDDFHILEINSLPSLGPRGSYVRAADVAGLDFPALVNRLVEVASARYFGTPTPPVVGETTPAPEKSVFGFLTQRRDEMERRLADWTNRRSRTHDPIGVASAAQVLSAALGEIGMKPVPQLGDDRSVSCWETAAGLEGGTLLVGHLDVPLEEGAARQAFRREPEWLHGEGVACSRAPLTAAMFALRALRHVRLLRKRRIGVLFYRDEGRDCRYSAEHITEAMGIARQVLVLRPGAAEGAVYTQRRGQRKYRLEISSVPRRPGSASRKPEVLVWLAQRLAEISAVSSRPDRISASVVDLHTEAFPMLLPHHVTATLLVTYAENGVADRAENRIREILGRGGPRWQLGLISDRPPMRDRPANRKLAKALAEAGRAWEIEVKTDSSVWPSVAGLAPDSTAVICGLGPVSRDIQTPHEAVQRISLVQRTLLLAEFLLRADLEA
jgi:D-alanine-D-alanine ligase